MSGTSIIAKFSMSLTIEERLIDAWNSGSNIYYHWAMKREGLSVFRDCKQHRHRPTSASVQSDQHLNYFATGRIMP